MEKLTDNKIEEKEKDILQQDKNLSDQNKDIKLIGNKTKREKEKDIGEEEITHKKICNCCKIPSSEQTLFSEKIENSESIIDLFSKGEEFIKLLKENIDKEITNNNLKINNLCKKCLVNEFISGGIKEINFQNKTEDNEKKEKKDQDSLHNSCNKKLNEIVAIYSLNLNITLVDIKRLKEEFIQLKNNVKEIFKKFCIKEMLNKNIEFQKLKMNIDNCQNVFNEIENKFDGLLKKLTTKSEMRPFILNSVLENNANQRNDILKLLKQLENEFENNYTEANNYNNINKNITENKNISEMSLLNNNSNELLKNNVLFPQNNLLNNGANLFNSGLNILPIGIQPNPANNLLMNNLMLNPTLNPSILNQINNTINLNSMLANMNNNINEANKNLNNINNLPFPNLNDLSNQNMNLSLANNIESIFYLRNLLSNKNMPPNNNIMNNPYINQINPNIIPPISLNNFIPPVSQMVTNNLVNNNCNPLNNNISSEEKNLMNKKVQINIEKNITNINPKANINQNLNNKSNVKDNNIINNNNNINNPIEINNNMNNPLLNNLNIQNPNNNGFLLTQLFNSVAENKEKSQINKSITYSNNIAKK